MSGPNLDEQIELMKAEFYASDLSPKSFDLTIGIRTKMLVATQVREARIDELTKMSGCPPIMVESTIADRIAQLRSTK